MIVLRVLWLCLALQASNVVALWPVSNRNAVADKLEEPRDSQRDIEAVLGAQASLDHWSQGPDCFRRAASTVRLRCNEVDMDQDERVQAAISMTLCELATAKHHAPPLECEAFAEGSSRQSALPSTSNQAECVGALSRSAQFWSSYSGYLREIPQLCFSIRRWHDIDTAKDIYKNATLEKLSLLQMLVNREKSAAEQASKMEENLEALQATTALLGSINEHINHISEATTSAIASEIQMLISASQEHLGSYQVELSKQKQEHLTMLEQGVTQIYTKHANSLETLSTAISDQVNRSLNDIFTHFQAREELLLEIATRNHHLFGELDSRIHQAQEDIGQLSGITALVSLTLNSSMTSLHSFVDDMELSAMNVSATALEHLNHLNASASDVRKAFSHEGPSALDIIYPWLLHSKIWLYTDRFPSLGMLWNVMQWLYPVCRLFGSFIMSFAVLLLSIYHKPRRASKNTERVDWPSTPQEPRYRPRRVSRFDRTTRKASRIPDRLLSPTAY